MNELINQKAVYRTAPATPGLIKTVKGKTWKEKNREGENQRGKPVKQGNQ